MDNKTSLRLFLKDSHSSSASPIRRNRSHYDRHIKKIDRAKFQLSPSSSSSKSTSSYQDSLEQTLLKKKTLKEYTIEISKENNKRIENLRSNNRKQQAVKKFRVSGWKDNYYTNLLDWSYNNFLCAAYDNDLFMYNMTIDDDFQSSLYRHYYLRNKQEIINSIKFSPINTRIAVGYMGGSFRCYDYLKDKFVINKKNHHQNRIATIEWNGNNIFTGSKDRLLKVLDARTGKQNIQFQKYHHQEICSIKSNGNLLASGGNDNNVFIFDIRKTLFPVFNYEHVAAIKALDWIMPNTLISGGGTLDRKIKFWKDGEGIFSEIDTGSQICALVASKNTEEIVSCQGFSLNQIIIWNKQKRRQITIHAHSNRVLYCALSPSGQYVATGAGDEQMKIWKLFGNKESGQWGQSDIR